MDNKDIVLLVMFLLVILIGTLTAWLVKRAKPQSRFYWFLGLLILQILIFGIKFFLAPALLSLILLNLMKKQDDNPLKDLLIGVGQSVFFGLSWALFGLYMLFGIGALYWMYTAVQLGSFFMFVLGLIPIFWIVGAYAFIFGVPEWVINFFG